MLEAYKSQCGRFQAKNWSKVEEIKKLELLKTKFMEQVQLMRTQINSLQAQLDHQRDRAEALSTQLTSHQIQEDNPDYEVK